MSLAQIYRTSLSLLTDLYQITMAYGYWKSGRAEQQAVFHAFFRKSPFGGGYAIAAGLETIVDFVEQFCFAADDIRYLAEIPGNDRRPLFDEGFLRYLSSLRIELDIDAIPEGTVVFPHEPLVRVKGAILQGQLLETAILNIINFQTLVATKAARIARAAQGEPILEFGLRRAQGIDGSLAASRAAYIGGCAATSNVLAGKLYGIPVRGTHAHSWVMSFDCELEAFENYAAAMPNNCVFLVDTYDTLEGVRNAIRVGRRLGALGYKMVGIRLDSGDLAYLSIEARKLLDEAGFQDSVIVASNDLDERLIESLKRQGATIAVWGVGTKLVTAYDQPALGGVYKLGAFRSAEGNWIPKVKLSEQLIKTSTPGILQIRRYRDAKRAVADMIFSELDAPTGSATIVDPLDPTRRREVASSDPYEDLLQPLFRNGNKVAGRPSLGDIRDRTHKQLSAFHGTILRLDNPHHYPVGLEANLYELKQKLVLEERKKSTQTRLASEP